MPTTDEPTITHHDNPEDSRRNTEDIAPDIPTEYNDTAERANTEPVIGQPPNPPTIKIQLSTKPRLKLEIRLRLL